MCRRYPKRLKPLLLQITKIQKISLRHRNYRRKMDIYQKIAYFDLKMGLTPLKPQAPSMLFKKKPASDNASGLQNHYKICNM